MILNYLILSLVLKIYLKATNYIYYKKNNY